MRRVRRLAVFAVFLGAMCLYFVLFATHHEPTHFGVAPQKFVPAQTLRFVDRGQRAIAELHIGSDRSLSLEILDAHATYTYRSDESAEGVILYGDAKESPGAALFIDMSGYAPVFNIDAPGGKSLSVYSKDWHQSSGKWFAELLRRNIFPLKPPNSAASIIPSEDVRLADRNGRTFAILGLTEFGDPAVVLLDVNARLLSSMLFARTDPSLSDVKWPSLFLFDHSGINRLIIELGPLPEPVLTIFEKGRIFEEAVTEMYVLDPITGQEVSRSPPKLNEGAIPWLRHDMKGAAMPVQLVDQRGNRLWESP